MIKEKREREREREREKEREKERERESKEGDESTHREGFNSQLLNNRLLPLV